MYKNISDLQEELFKITYLRMYDAFINFINNNVFDYGLSFNSLNIEDVHNKTINEMLNKEKIISLIKNKLSNLEYKINLYNKKNLEVPFDILKRKKVLNKIIDDSKELIYDYYFKYKDNYYTLNMSYDFEFFGYSKEYFEENYSNFNNLVCCQLFEFNKYFEDNFINSSILFVYDIIAKKVVEILNIDYFENIKDKRKNCCLSDEKVLKKIILSRST